MVANANPKKLGGNPELKWTVEMAGSYRSPGVRLRIPSGLP
jgi:hypothetical protein